MKPAVIAVIISLVLMLWLLHGLDIEYYTHVSEYNEAFDNNLKFSVALIFLIILLLLSSETSDLNPVL